MMLRRCALIVLQLFLLQAAFAQRKFFWDNPAPFSNVESSFPQTAACADFAMAAWQESEIISPQSQAGIAGSGNIYISLAIRESPPPQAETEEHAAEQEGENAPQTLKALPQWIVHRRVAGPFQFAGMEPSIFTTMIDKSGRIFLCVAVSTTETAVYISENRGIDWTSTIIRTGSVSNAGLTQQNRENAADTLVPRIFQMSDGSYSMFVVRNAGDSITLFYARSQNGKTWQAFQNFITEPGLPLSFLPVHLVYKGIDVIVFQSFVTATNYSTFQLYLKFSPDGGRTWTRARRLTDFMDPYTNTTAAADAFNNERAHLSIVEDQIFIVWERRYGAGSPAIYGMTLNSNFERQGMPELINTIAAYCNNPISWTYRGELNVIWFDNRRGGNTVITAAKIGTVWENREMSRAAENAIFPRPVQSGDDLYFFWQEIAGDQNRIFILSPDLRADPPVIHPQNFNSGKRVAGDVARIGWDVPDDPSGVEGYSWSWSRDSSVEPPLTRMSWTDTNSVERIADADGPWYFKIRALDNAGNWSESGGVVFVRDRTPPPPVQFVQPRVDANGFLLSNTFTLRWQSPEVDDLAGYHWTLDYAGPAGRATAIPAVTELPAVPGASVRIMSAEPFAQYDNRDNGLWRLTVTAIDDVGNVGRSRTLSFKLNKYIPHTFITYVDAAQELDGDLDMTIIGRGFSENGNVTRIYFSRESDAEYERILNLSDAAYTVTGDREIVLQRVENLPAGNYYISVEHPIRGMARSPHSITVGRSLTYKFGDFTRHWEVSWLVELKNRLAIDVWTVVFLLVMTFCLVLFVFTVRGTTLVLVEGRAIKKETLALLSGEEMPRSKRKKLRQLRAQGAGLRLKLSFFTVALVGIVVFMVSAPLYLMMNANQRQTLLQSLWDRSSVLLESVAQGARTFLPANNELELGFLPAQTDAVQEARYVTISGFGRQSSLTADYVWASNDPSILSKINTAELEPGASRITDSITERLIRIEAALNQQAQTEAGDLAESVAQLNREGQRLAAQDDELSRREMANIQAASRELSTRITGILNSISAEIYAEPAFDINAREIADTTYILFKPVMFRHTGSDIYVRGWVRLEVSSESIVKVLKDAQQRIFRIISIIALAAITLGAVLAFIVATLIVLPVKTLVRHVEMIRDTEDKTQLAGAVIAKKSSDEIGVLSETINEMTETLVKAALASQDLLIGKEIQKKFIPLELDHAGNKLSSGYKALPHIEFFGYYEGAKGVSGDYFDYRDLDGRYYAIIKCDVAGKGIPAALIMIQVATMFINFFANWKPNEQGMHIDELVYQINAFIEELGFKGRFAAFTLCLFDSETGLLRFCNAGDNLIHYYDASEQKFKILTLPQTPATGVLPNALVQMKGGYKIQTLTLDHGDILLLYTDGIEEAKRKFRNDEFAEIVCDWHGAPRDTPHGNHVVGQDSEEMGADRVEAIINAVMRCDVYKLKKYHNPHGDVRYHFDFSSCEDSVEDLIMSLVSVEKIFRLWKNPTSESRVLVDKKVDSFLQKHFVEYDRYCTGVQEYAENPAYIYYTNMNEDEQYDDLTILGIKRK